MIEFLLCAFPLVLAGTILGMGISVYYSYKERNKVDGEIHISKTERGVVWNIQTDHPEKIEEANGQIVQFKIVKESDDK